MTEAVSYLAESHACFAELVQRALRVEPSARAGLSSAPAELAGLKSAVSALVADQIGLTWELGEQAAQGGTVGELARFACAELRSVLATLTTAAQGSDEEELARVIAARDRVVDVGLALEQEIAAARGAPSRLCATRHVVSRRMEEKEATRAKLATNVQDVAEDSRRPWVERARKIAAQLSRALYVPGWTALAWEERQVIRGLCERVIALVWATAPTKREDVAREIVGDAAAFAALVLHMGGMSGRRVAA